MNYTSYLSLGDSMSMDLFPALDAGATDVAVALERIPSAGSVAKLGAASLFHTNDNIRWPEEEGHDLVTSYPGITMESVAVDGATIGDVFGEQIPAIGTSDEPTLVTLTIGSEDIFSVFASTPKKSLMDRIIADLCDAFDLLVPAIRAVRPNGTIIVTTVTDPSDRLGRIDGVLEEVGKLPLRALDAFNDRVRAVAGSNAGHGVLLADAYGHFLGHGAMVPAEERWYWRRSPLEPNVYGAHELRTVWLRTLADAQSR